ncbi:hypothetical protein RUND412_000409 [Rhizina undulata]
MDNPECESQAKIYQIEAPEELLAELLEIEEVPGEFVEAGERKEYNDAMTIQIRGILSLFIICTFGVNNFIRGENNSIAAANGIIVSIMEDYPGLKSNQQVLNTAEQAPLTSFTDKDSPPSQVLPGLHFTAIKILH